MKIALITVTLQVMIVGRRRFVVKVISLSVSIAASNYMLYYCTELLDASTKGGVKCLYGLRLANPLLDEHIF